MTYHQFMRTIIATPSFRRDVEKLWSEDERGGTRVVCFTKLEHGEIWLLVIYKKGKTDTIPAHLLKAIKEVIDND